MHDAGARAIAIFADPNRFQHPRAAFSAPLKQNRAFNHAANPRGAYALAQNSKKNCELNAYLRLLS
jgi:hypothetical protein